MEAMGAALVRDQGRRNAADILTNVRDSGVVERA